IRDDLVTGVQTCALPILLEELRTETAMTVHEEGDDLIFDHMYIERRMTPLNLYLRTATETQAEKAALDYGQCIRDLAYTNIFAGDRKSGVEEKKGELRRV